MSKTVTVLNPETGQVGELSRRLFRIPSIGGILVEVEPGTKSYDPKLYVPKTSEEFVEAHPGKAVVPAKDKPAKENKDND